MTLRLPWLSPDPAAPFPPVSRALREPNGLLAAGGDLRPQRLLNAYRHGIFPWFSEGEPILWWSPAPRAVFRTDGVHLSRRDRRTLHGLGWTASADTRFDDVIDACARMPRPGQDGTWITEAMQAAYRELHRLGHAHSVDVIDRDGALVGGIYGVAVGEMFYGESMVSLASGGSKAALAALAHRLRDWGWPLIDAQVENPHLMRLGAEVWPRTKFMAAIEVQTTRPAHVGSWTAAFGTRPIAEIVDAS